MAEAEILRSYLPEKLEPKEVKKIMHMCCGYPDHLDDEDYKKADPGSYHQLAREVDDLNIDGDYIESQAFAFLAIRSYLGLPTSFPSTTNCKKPSVGGTIIKNS